MSDYKNRDDVVTEIKRFKGYLDDDMITRLTIAIDRIPNADVMPVRHGHWGNMFNGKFTGGAYWYRCSNCGRIVPDVRNGGWNYCPNCGARMDGGGEDEL